MSQSNPGKNWIKRILKIVGIMLVSLIVLIGLGPFLIPVRPLQGLATAEQLAGEDSQFVSLPHRGTDGVTIHFVATGPDTMTGPTFLLLA